MSVYIVCEEWLIWTWNKLLVRLPRHASVPYPSSSPQPCQWVLPYIDPQRTFFRIEVIGAMSPPLWSAGCTAVRSWFQLEKRRTFVAVILLFARLAEWEHTEWRIGQNSDIICHSCSLGLNVLVVTIDILWSRNGTSFNKMIFENNLSLSYFLNLHYFV